MNKVNLVKRVIIIQDAKPTKVDKLLKTLACVRALAFTAIVCKIALEVLDARPFVEIKKAGEDEEQTEGE